MFTPPHVLAGAILIRRFGRLRCAWAAAMLGLAGVAASQVHAQLSGVRGALGFVAGSIEGTLIARQQPAVGVTVAIRETGQATATNADGSYRLTGVMPGTYRLVVSGAAYRSVHITDVVVRPAATMFLNAVELHRQSDVTELEPYVVKGQPVEVAQLDDFTVDKIDGPPPPSMSAGLPRTANDAQPYYIFNAAAIAESGAINVEDFFRRRVPMDVNRMPNARVVTPMGSGYGSGVAGNTSTIDLTGFGQNSTLVLVNGRRLPGLSFNGITYSLQPDVNGIPLAAIEKVEVLPVSASGIHGAGAVGGVVNIILRRDYEGATVSLWYENTFDADTPTRSGSLTFGRSFEGGRTRVLGTITRQEMEPLRFRDRRALLESYRARALANDPSTGAPVNDPTYVPLGSTPNIRAVPFNGFRDGRLVQIPMVPLFGPGTEQITHVPPGYTGGDDLAPFRANAGKFNLEVPDTAQSWTTTYGLNYPLGHETRVDAGTLVAQRAFGPNLEVFAELHYADNKALGHTQGSSITHLQVPANAPSNIFRTEVRVAAPIDFGLGPTRHVLRTSRVVAGFRLGLPRDWSLEGDYNYGRNRQELFAPDAQQAVLQADIISGAVNIFRDLLAYPIPTARYYGWIRTREESWMQEYNLRAAGPLGRLPGGDARATGMLAWHWAETEPGEEARYYRATSQNVIPYHFRGLGQLTRSAYAEVSLPFFGRPNARRGWRELELQLAGRIDAAQVSGLTVDRLPDRPDRNRANSSTYTAGLTYAPSDDVMLRASIGTAFLPPDFVDLLPRAPPFLNPSPVLPPLNTINGWSTQTISDPRRGGERYAVGYSFGGNPELRPERSRNLHLGLVLTPSFLRGLRLSVDYVRTAKRDEVRVISPQAMIDQEEDFAARITRAVAEPGDQHAVGRVTFTDTSALNFHRTESATYNAMLSYAWKTDRSSWRLHGAVNSAQHFQVQNVASGKMEEAIGGRAGRPKFVGNAGFVWSRDRWSAGWSANVFGTARATIYSERAQRATHVKRQIFHDMFVGYKIPAARDGITTSRRLLAGLALQVGIKNVFNTPPAYDANTTWHLLSPYGDIRMASYYLSLRKEL